jgi:uncharacterized ion transporter superfamily protein YfcC
VGNNQSAPNGKRGIGNVHPLVMVTFITLFAVLLTHLIPAGTFQNVTVDGRTTIDVSSYTRIAQTPFNLIHLPTTIMKSFASVLPIIVLICAGGGAFEVLRKTGTVNAVIGLVIKETHGKEKYALWIMGLGFSAISCTITHEVFIPFTGLCITLALSLGYEPFVGVALLIVSSINGMISSALQPATVNLQSMLGLPLYSGLGYRIIVLVIFSVVSTAYLMRYAEKTRKDPSKSVILNISEEEKKTYDDLNSVVFSKMNIRHVLVVVSMVAIFAAMVIGGLRFKWENYDFAGLFLVMAIICGPIGGLSLNDVARCYVSGVNNLTSTVITIGLASSVANVLISGNIIYTIIHSLTKGLGGWPPFLTPIGIVFIVFMCTIFIPSFNGKLPMLIPILGPACAALRVTQQECAFAYTFGDCFAILLLPYQAGLVGFLGVGHVSYGSWIKFFWKLNVLWILLGCIILIIFTAIGVGPF